MAVALDVASSQQSPGVIGTTSPFSFTIGASATLLICDVEFGEQSGNVQNRITSVTWNSSAMTLVGTEIQVTGTSGILRRYKMLAPATGTANIVVNQTPATGTGGCLIVSIRSYSGTACDIQNTATATSNGATNSPALSITSGTGQIVDACFCHGDTISGIGASGTQRTLNNVNGFTAANNMITGTWTGAASVAVGATSAVNDSWLCVGSSVYEPGGSATTGPPYRRRPSGLLVR